MLVGLIIGFFFATAALPGEAFIDAMNDFAKTAIAEPERQKVIREHVKEMKQELKGFSKKVKKAGKQIAKLNRDHDSSQEALETALAELNRERIATQKRLVEIRFKMKAQMSREEWAAALQSP